VDLNNTIISLCVKGTQAELVKDESVKSFYPSLYLSLGRAHELTGHPAEAQRFYDLAAQLGFPHQPE
jgi:hypothetical protein